MAAPDSIRSLREELPAHGAWVRRLARGLVRDEAAADDLAQDAALAALRRDGSIHGALGPWLARVTRNFARRGWRDRARRAGREQAVARAEAVPGADEAAARLEVQRRLVEELAALDPAVRHALVRRYFDGWTAARIARESGEPAATVRWRLQRGLAELRARLDHKSGGDGIQWRLALLPVCGSSAPWSHVREAFRPLAKAGTIQGALTMKVASQALAAGALVTAVGLGAWWNAERDESPRSTQPVAAEAHASEPVEQRNGASDPVHPAPTGRESVATASPPSKPEAAPGPEPARALRVSGRCVDERFVPIAGVRVWQTGADRGRLQSTSLDGTFSIEVEPSRWSEGTFRFEATGFATRFIEAALPREGGIPLGDVVLVPGGSVRGRVLGPEGAAFGGATVTATTPDLSGSLEEARVGGPVGSNLLTGVSGDDGSFEITGVGAGPTRVWAGAQGMRYAVSAPLEVRAGQASDEIELRLDAIRRDDRITGIVLSPQGEPVQSVGIGGLERSGPRVSSWNGAVTGADGRFEMSAKKNHVYDLEVMGPEDWEDLEVKGVVPGTHDLELRFRAARWIEVRVRAKDGAELEDYETAAVGEDERTDRLFGRVTAVRHPGGKARVRVPSKPFYVRVDARGFAPAEEGPLSPDAAPDTLAFELVPEPGLRGRVLERGEPLAGARVALHAADPRQRIEHQGYPSLVDPHESDATTTDVEGRFTLRVRRRGTFVVRAESAGRAAADTRPLELDPSTGRAGLELVLGQGGALEGRVRVAPGRDPAGVIVAMNRGDAFPRTQRVDAEGHFRFDGLTAGPWHLTRGTSEFNPSVGGSSYSGATTPTVIPFNCLVREGETLYQDLDLCTFEPCELSGLLLVNGVPAKDWGVTGWPGAKEVMVATPPSTALAADGTFALTIDEAGALRLSFSPPAELEGEGRIDALTEIQPGANEWRADFAMGRLVGRCFSPVLAGEQSLYYTTAEGVAPSCWLPIQPDEDGRYVLPFVPAGAGSIRRMGQVNDALSWSVVAETQIPVRAERVLDVP